MQQTIKKNVRIFGTGVHLGKPVTVNIKPAPVILYQSAAETGYSVFPICLRNTNMKADDNGAAKPKKIPQLFMLERSGCIRTIVPRKPMPIASHWRKLVRSFRKRKLRIVTKITTVWKSTVAVLRLSLDTLKNQNTNPRKPAVIR